MASTTARMAALIITAGLALTACSSDDGDKRNPDAAPAVNCQDPNITNVERALCGPGSGMVTPPNAGATTGPPPATKPAVDCADTSLSMGDWTRYCGPGTGNTIKQTGDGPPVDTSPKPLGTAAETGGSTTTGGTLDTTPTTVVYSPRTTRDTDPSKDTFVIVTVKEHNTGAVPADPEGQWTYTAPDGEALTTGVVLLSGAGFNSIGEQLQPGSFHWGYRAWAIRGDQRGGTLSYEDSSGVTYRWQIPAQDAGPQIAEVKSGLN